MSAELQDDSRSGNENVGVRVPALPLWLETLDKSISCWRALKNQLFITLECGLA